MIKFVKALTIVATLAVALVMTTQVFAQGPAPTSPQTPGTGYGAGGNMMGGRGMRGNTAMGDGILHDAMVAVYAQELGVSVEDLNARLNNGETISQIAAEKGLTAEQFSALMTDARSQAIDQAVAEGTLTQEQADWLKTRGAQMNSGTAGIRGGRGGRGERGAYAGNQDCPYFPQTTP